MAGGKKISKNSKTNRGPSTPEKFVNGKKVTAVTYIGGNKSHGRYTAARFEDGTFAVDGNGKPLHYSSIPGTKT